ncbi:PREDICTED: protein FAM63A isoform X2 [Calidris pugnax]|uniref:protein FAM63A isoform X2 n=1 Tax=Calidris pugnax TaxID=198806 RepID=UPI00071E57DC|nr:PREDICTED: protein FAM63A isoform X2 [Calidris pugnax]
MEQPPEGEGMVPKKEGMVPEQEEVVPKKEGTVSEGEGMVPKQEGMVPKEEGMVPEREGKVPKKEETIPKCEGMVPEQEEMVPKKEGMVPKREEMVPKKEGMVPEQEEMVPKKEGMIPEREGKVPKHEEMVPKKEGTIPKREEMVPKKEGMVPEQEEVVPKKEGMVPAPSSSKETHQLQEEAVGREEVPAGGQESPAPDGQAPVVDVPSSPGVGQPGCAPHLPSHEQPREDAEEEQPVEGGGALAGAPVPSPGAGAVGGPVEPPQTRTPTREADFYCVKWISWKGERTPVIMQSENGPCPLLAIMNILFLQWKVKLPPQKEVVTSEELMAHLGDCILSTQPREPSEGLQLNFQQNINDTMTVLPKLSTGLDVNVRFTGVSDFEYTPECIVFDLLNVPLYHGWLVDPQSPEVVQAVGKLSYNQLVEKIITCKQASDSSLVSEGLVAEQFLESTASQLTYHGLCELTAAVREGELSVFFRNNHFSTMIKHKGHLYLLVTDQGFLQEEGVVWESLHNVEGDSCFCDTHFHLSHAPGKEGATMTPPDHHLQQRQVDQQQQGQEPSGLSDLELARQLQQEEYQRQQVPAQARAQPGARPAGERRQRQRPDFDCVLL